MYHADLYLSYVNEFTTLKGFAEYHDLTLEKAEEAIEIGREMHAARAAAFKVRDARIGGVRDDLFNEYQYRLS